MTRCALYRCLNASGRIPSEWQWHVVCAAQAAGHSYATAEWLMKAHAALASSEAAA